MTSRLEQPVARPAPGVERRAVADAGAQPGLDVVLFGEEGPHRGLALGPRGRRAGIEPAPALVQALTVKAHQEPRRRVAAAARAMPSR